MIQIAADTSLNFTNTSSGLQSLVPMFVVLSYLYSSVYKDEKGMRLSDSAENESLLRLIYQELFVKKNRTDGNVQTFRGIGDIKLRFDDDKAADECEAIYKRYVKTDHCDIFLEEPENNLFPPTQKDVAKWLIESTLREHENTLSITTHSPYMLGAFLEENIELGLFYCLKRDEGVVIHTATEEELQTIYSDGIDAFFNLENLSELN
ncbi:ATP-binding protein [Prevotella denticola]|uniref:ATP-binding protein n=1 Tax=Prevotella denticola TaxID=28129 RepID=UPI002151532D|nr:ATP-binding protein [Prevotella denticola]